MPPALRRIGALRRFLEGQAAGGIVLMAAAVVALGIANSPWGAGYAALLHAPAGPLSIGHWINDGLMALFFLLVGLEMKRELADGGLATWRQRALPGIGALGGMIAPALVYLAFNRGPGAIGWAIPAATDIAFALGVVALLGKRVPASLRLFLAALAIIDDLGAVLIIAVFYTHGLSLPDLAGAGAVLGVLAAMNRLRMRRLSLYLLAGLLLWVLVWRSGLHATLAGVMLAFAIPMGRMADEDGGPLHRPRDADSLNATPPTRHGAGGPFRRPRGKDPAGWRRCTIPLQTSADMAQPGDGSLPRQPGNGGLPDSSPAAGPPHGAAGASPLHRLEGALHRPVGFLVVPLFGLANAGVAVVGLPPGAFAAPVTLGVGLGLLAGKAAGVFGCTAIAIRMGLADRPAHAGVGQMLGVSLLCGIGFTMSIFITLLAFPADPLSQAEAKIGVLAGSLIAGLLGYLTLRVSAREG